MTQVDDDGGHRDDPGARASRRPTSGGQREARDGQRQQQQMSSCSVEPATATRLGAPAWSCASAKRHVHRYSRIDAYSSTSGVLRLR